MVIKNIPPEEQLLAKSDPFESLFDHTLKVINSVERIFQNLPESIQDLSIFKAAVIAATFHDSGKAHPEFQKVLRNKSNEWNKRRHEIISANYFAYWLSSLDRKEWAEFSEKEMLFVWFAILFHHKSLAPGLAESSTAFFSNSLHLSRIPIIAGNKYFTRFDMKYWFENQNKMQEFFKQINQIISQKQINLPLNRMAIYPGTIDKFSISDFLENILKLQPNENVIINDLGFSQQYWQNLFYIDKQRYLIPSFDLRYNLAITIGLVKSADHLASGGFQPNPIPLFQSYKINKTLYPFQERVGTTIGSLILQAPTGSGKTEAAIAWVKRNQKKNGRFFYILPYQASINAMFSRLTSWAKISHDHEEFNVGISHSKNIEFLYSYFQDNEIFDQKLILTPKSLTQLTKEIYYPIKISTAHQLLRFVLFGKGWESLLLELVDSTIVFDEIHAYEPFILGLLLGLMMILRKYRARILIMTATIPTFIIQLIKEKVFSDLTNEHLPILRLESKEAVDNQILKRIRHKINFEEGILLGALIQEDFQNLIINRYKANRKQLFICNTIGVAQKVYDWFKQQGEIDVKQIRLFHSHFNYRDRREIEQELETNLKNLILIATQVVEVSLDISYDYGYFEPAPIDALIQRMGRVNRQGNSFVDLTREANIIIFTQGENDSKIYDRELVQKTLNALASSENKPITEMDLVGYIDKVYPKYSSAQEKELQRGWNHSLIQHHQERLEAGLQKEWIADLIENADQQLDVIPKECESEFRCLWNEKEFVQLRLLFITLNITHLNKNDYYQIPDLNYINILNGNRWKYDKEYGLRLIK